MLLTFGCVGKRRLALRRVAARGVVSKLANFGSTRAHILEELRMQHLQCDFYVVQGGGWGAPCESVH